MTELPPLRHVLTIKTSIRRPGSPFRTLAEFPSTDEGLRQLLAVLDRWHAKPRRRRRFATFWHSS